MPCGNMVKNDAEADPMNFRKITSIHYGTSSVLLAIYGAQVCPFLESLSVFQLTVPIFLTIGALYCIRLQLGAWLDSRALNNRVKTQFQIDFLLFIFGGIALATFNALVHQFPLVSGFKVVFGMGVMGFFIACHLALHREHNLFTLISASGDQIILDKAPFPLTRKFSVFACVSMVILGSVILLVVLKDLAYITSLASDADLTKAAIHVALEITFVLAVVLTYLLKIISKFGLNLQVLLNSQRNILMQVAKGELSARVPVASNDEFGLIAKNTNHTIASLQTQTFELTKVRDATILALSSLAETRDNETGAHILRTQKYVAILAEHLKSHPRFSTYLTDAQVELIVKSAPLHDAGKVGIPDAILLKPGPLNDEEYKIMQQHPMIGSQALQSAREQLGSNSFLSVSCEIMETHHEKWDGSGYPRNLRGEDIPISGRLMALADVYDALISERVYKKAFTHEKARDIIIEGRGTHFDPDIVEAFMELQDEFQQIAATFSKAKTAFRAAS